MPRNVFRLNPSFVTVAGPSMPWSLWQKWQECHFSDIKPKTIFLLVSKGCFWCKMRGGIRKSGPNALQCLLLAKMGLFWKRWFCCFLAQISASYFFRKLVISQKVSIVEHWDQLFWIPRIILHQIHPLLTKKIFFWIFNKYMTFLLFLSQQPYKTYIHLDLGRPKHVLHKLGRFFLLSIYHKITKILQVA